MNERLIYSWDDKEGRHMVCSECLKAYGQIAVCTVEADSKEAICENCERVARADADKDEE
jgi:hypothetical protein